MEQAPDQNTNTTPPPAMPPVAEEAKGPAYGSILGIILIVAILVAGAFYVWNERINMDTNTVEGEVLPDGSMPTVEGAADVEEGPNGPMPI